MAKVAAPPAYLVTLDEAADRLGTTRYRVKRLIETGMLPGQHVGRRWLIARAVFETAMEQGGLVPAAAPSFDVASLIGRTLDLAVNGIPVTVQIRGIGPRATHEEGR